MDEVPMMIGVSFRRHVYLLAQEKDAGRGRRRVELGLAALCLAKDAGGLVYLPADLVEPADLGVEGEEIALSEELRVKEHKPVSDERRVIYAANAVKARAAKAAKMADGPRIRAALAAQHGTGRPDMTPNEAAQSARRGRQRFVES